MNLEDITPVVLTFDEEPNIRRCLDRLSWARRVVVVDSYSNDKTGEIAMTYRNVSLVHHAFVDFASQWNFAIALDEIDTLWILALDADFMVEPDVVRDLQYLDTTGYDGFEADFVYAINGKHLRGSLYPPLVVLFRGDRVKITQEGHNQVASVSGHVGEIPSPIIHDDRKPLSRWISNQVEYMEREAEKITSTPYDRLSRADKIRRARFIAPLAAFLYALFWKDAILDGKAGLYYALQRMTAELILTLKLIERDLGSR